MLYNLFFVYLLLTGSSIGIINKTTGEFQRDLGIKYDAVDTTGALPVIRFSYQKVSGIGHEPGVCRRDPSDIIKVGTTYYIWYSKVRNEPGVYNYPSGYSAKVWYATSPDGVNWTERGQALGKGNSGSWDEEGVYTPNILVANNKYYLTYDGADRPWTEKNKAFEGLAVAATPDGPWRKLAQNPVNVPTTTKYADNDPRNFDSFRVCDACLIIRGGKYWWYYKGRGRNLTPGQTNLGVAIAKNPEGPYIKQKNNPVVQGGHEVLVWPHSSGVAALIGVVGPPNVRNTIQYALDGKHFRPVARIVDPPTAPGGFRPDAFTGARVAKPMAWGISMANLNSDCYLIRFECELPKTW